MVMLRVLVDDELLGALDARVGSMPEMTRSRLVREVLRAAVLRAAVLPAVPFTAGDVVDVLKAYRVPVPDVPAGRLTEQAGPVREPAAVRVAKAVASTAGMSKLEAQRAVREAKFE